MQHCRSIRGLGNTTCMRAEVTMASESQKGTYFYGSRWCDTSGWRTPRKTSTPCPCPAGGKPPFHRTRTGTAWPLPAPRRYKQLHLKSHTLHMQKVSRSERGQMFIKNWLSEIHHLILHIFLRITFKLTLLKNKFNTSPLFYRTHSLSGLNSCQHKDASSCTAR